MFCKERRRSIREILAKHFLAGGSDFVFVIYLLVFDDFADLIEMNDGSTSGVELEFFDVELESAVH